ncbi:MAG: hypothetical protein ABW001_11325 [Mycobacterium sp.]
MADEELREQARLLVLAAYGDPDAMPSLERLTVALSRLDAEVETLARCRAAASTAPGVDEVERACAALRSAADAQADAEHTAGALSADRIQFLETSLEFHDRHGTQPCPVCAMGTLDDEWVARARAALAAERDAASALRVARSETHRARRALIALVDAVDAPPAEDVGLSAMSAARVAHQSFSTLSTDDDTGLADRVARGLPELRAAYDALLQAAAPRLEVAIEAQKWLQALASTER